MEPVRVSSEGTREMEGARQVEGKERERGGGYRSNKR